MSTRELVVLGTASQVPTRYRNHNGYLMMWDGRGYLFDPGEGTQRQMLLAGVSASQITHICVSHFHGDHSLGLAGMIQRISLDGVQHEIPVRYPASGQVYFDRLRRSSIFLDKSRLRPCPLTEEGEQEAGPPALVASRLEHTVESWGYRIQDPDKWRLDPDRLRDAGVRGPAAGVLLRDGRVDVDGRSVSLRDVGWLERGRSMAFVMDTRLCEGAIALARDVDLLVAESTYLASEAAEARERGHMTAGDAARLAVEAGARRLVLTHFSQRHPTVQPFLEEAGAIHPDVHAARDLDRIALPIRS
ncbi:MAG: ribonuclease Z [Myxococcales bacterium]|nr:ribonuclease Z [Myxococcales bacterium]